MKRSEMKVDSTVLFCSSVEIDWPKCERGEKRWNKFCFERYPGKGFMTPKTATLEQMADCSEREFSRLATAEVKASRKYWQNNAVSGGAGAPYTPRAGCASGSEAK